MKQIVTKPADLKQKITAQFHNLSTAQKNLAGYLLEHYDKAAFLTASRLGAVVGVSESTVIRFATTIGYHGYPEMQEAMQEMVRNKLNTVSRLRKSAELSGENATVREILQTDMENLRKTLQEISVEAFEAAVEEIVKAKTIYVLGLRSAHCAAVFLGFYLEMIKKKVRVVPWSVSSIMEQLSGIGGEDLVIAISFPRYTRQTIEGTACAKKAGARILAITDSIVSPLAQWADLTLTAESDLGSFIESFTAPLSVINALVTAVGRKQKTKTISTLEQLEKLWEQYNIFYIKEKGVSYKNGHSA